MPLPFAPLPHAFPAASASTPSGGVGARSAPRPASAFSQSGGEFMGVEEILDLTKGVPPQATDRVPNRDADRERYQFLPPLRYHDPMVHEPITNPCKDLELKRRTAAE